MKKIVLPLILSMVFLFCSGSVVHASSEDSTSKYLNFAEFLIEQVGYVPDWYNSDYKYLCFSYGGKKYIYIFEPKSNCIVSKTYYRNLDTGIWNGENYKFCVEGVSRYTGKSIGSASFDNPLSFSTAINDTFTTATYPNPPILYSDLDVYFYDDVNDTYEDYYESSVIDNLISFSEYCQYRGIPQFPYYQEEYCGAGRLLLSLRSRGICGHTPYIFLLLFLRLQ